MQKLNTFFKNNDFMITWLIVLAVFMGWIFFRVFFYDFNIVDGESMTPSFYDGQRVLVRKYDKEDFSRYDVVLCDTSEGVIIKRAIRFSGETVRIDSDGYVYVNDKKIPDKYQWDLGYGYDDFECTVGNNQVFVLGDNRSNSKDSRFYGPFYYSQIRGVVVYSLFDKNNVEKEVYYSPSNKNLISL